MLDKYMLVERYYDNENTREGLVPFPTLNSLLECIAEQAGTVYDVKEWVIYAYETNCSTDLARYNIIAVYDNRGYILDFEERFFDYLFMEA